MGVCNRFHVRTQRVRLKDLSASLASLASKATATSDCNGSSLPPSFPALVSRLLRTEKVLSCLQVTSFLWLYHHFGGHDAFEFQLYTTHNRKKVGRLKAFGDDHLKQPKVKRSIDHGFSQRVMNCQAFAEGNAKTKRPSPSYPSTRTFRATHIF